MGKIKFATHTRAPHSFRFQHQKQHTCTVVVVIAQFIYITRFFFSIPLLPARSGSSFPFDIHRTRRHTARQSDPSQVSTRIFWDIKRSFHWPIAKKGWPSHDHELRRENPRSLSIAAHDATQVQRRRAVLAEKKSLHLLLFYTFFVEPFVSFLLSIGKNNKK